ncbi:MAG: hypothetical protein WAV41_01890 [Microgenomates group bacterium]
MTIFYIDRIDVLVDTAKLNISIDGGKPFRVGQMEAWAIVARHNSITDDIVGALNFLRRNNVNINSGHLSSAESIARSKYGEVIMPYRRT